MTLYGWCLTVNNWTVEDAKKLESMVGICGIKYMSFSEEVGDSGTPHLQGYFQSNHNKLTRFVKHFKGHIMKQRGNSDEARDYCRKDGSMNWREFGEYTYINAPGQGIRTDLSRLKDLIKEGKSYDEVVELEFENCAKFHGFIKERITARDSINEMNRVKAQLEDAQLKPWQETLLEIIQEPACPRKIHWIWDHVGNMGKSWMCTYLGVKHNACILTSGKKSDMAYIFAQKPSPIVVFDLSRTNEKFLDGVYSLAEDLKNGRVVSTKYECKTIFFRPPHVIFFANYEPDYNKWSADRYFVTELRE